MKTTLNKIRQHLPCKDGWETLLKHLGKFQADDVELPLLTILESNGLDDTLWCLRAVEGFDKEKRLLAVAFAREVQHLMQDPRSIEALDVAERFANGEATEEELRDAADAAADAARDAARDAAYVAYYAADAAGATCAADDANDAAGVAARDAAYAAYYAAYYAARDVAGAAYYVADAANDMRQKQVEIFKKFMV